MDNDVTREETLRSAIDELNFNVKSYRVLRDFGYRSCGLVKDGESLYCDYISDKFVWRINLWMNRCENSIMFRGNINGIEERFLWDSYHPRYALMFFLDDYGDYMEKIRRKYRDHPYKFTLIDLNSYCDNSWIFTSKKWYDDKIFRYALDEANRWSYNKWFDFGFEDKFTEKLRSYRGGTQK